MSKRWPDTVPIHPAAADVQNTPDKVSIPQLRRGQLELLALLLIKKEESLQKIAARRAKQTHPSLSIPREAGKKTKLR
jgi:hypothetical protein